MTKSERNIYITNIDADIAKEEYFNKINKKTSCESVSVTESLGRITYKAVFARMSSPYYNASAMDGIVVIAESTYGACEVNPIVLEEGKDFLYVNTGNVIPTSYNAVIMIEDVIELDDNHIKIIVPAYPWQHIRPIGEDIVCNEMILPSNHKIRPLDLGALISGGIETITIYQKPNIGIMPTGSEIVASCDELEDGKIIDSNSAMFEGLVIECGGIPNKYMPVKDDYDVLKDAIIKGAKENDILLVNAGTSAGSKDFVVQIVNEIGSVVVHGVALKPGKPVILGFVEKKPVIGIPGYPVSAYIVFETFVKPLIYKYFGINKEIQHTIKATLSKRIVSSFKHKELVRATIGYINNKYVATPLVRGAGVTMSLVKADGIVTIPKNSEGLEVGEEIEVSLLKPIGSIKETLVSIGSHDLFMDIIADMMNLSSAHVGSMGGIMSMRRDECHISPIHLLDENTGEYNVSYVNKFFKNKKMVLIKGVKRLQGLIVQKGNPMKIKSFEDVVDHVYINRQKGSGTRILLDYNLKKLMINSKDITGYEREMTTHMAVAVNVESGLADAGLGVFSAAKAMELDFVPIGYENYDFLVSCDNLNDSKIQKFIKILKSEQFKNQINEIGGYEFDNTGDIIFMSEQI